MAKRFNLDENVRKEVSNLKFDNATHHEICVNLVTLAAQYGMTIVNIIYTCNKEGHKQEAFKKGYTKFNLDKAKAICEMCKAFAEYNGNPALIRNGNVVHACTKYYEKKSQNVNDFKNDLSANWKPWAKAPKTMKEIVLGLNI